MWIYLAFLALQVGRPTHQLLNALIHFSSCSRLVIGPKANACFTS
jgi:hypothetical protein